MKNVMKMSKKNLLIWMCWKCLKRKILCEISIFDDKEQSKEKMLKKNEIWQIKRNVISKHYFWFTTFQTLVVQASAKIIKNRNQIKNNSKKAWFDQKTKSFYHQISRKNRIISPQQKKTEDQSILLRWLSQKKLLIEFKLNSKAIKKDLNEIICRKKFKRERIVNGDEKKQNAKK